MPDNTTPNQPEWKTNPRCDPDQLAMLRRCSDAKDVTEWNEWRIEDPDVDIWLRGADLRGAFLNEVNLSGAFLEGAGLQDAELERCGLVGARLDGCRLMGANLAGAYLTLSHCNGAYFHLACLKDSNLQNARLEGVSLLKTDLERASLNQARLQGAHLEGCNIKGADLEGALVDGRTWIWRCEVDGDTYCAGVGLADASLQPGLKQTLEYIVRRKRWLGKVNPWLSWNCLKPKWKWRQEYNRDPLDILACLFWWPCDFGASTWRIIGLFAFFSFFFAALYYSFPGMVQMGGGEQLTGMGHALYFSVVTMTTLGFGDIHASPTSGWGQGLLVSQVILGYVLLGALICRLGIVFQSDGPPVGLTRPWWKRAILAAAVLVPIAAFFICKPLFIDAHRQAALDRLAAERAAAHVEPVEPVEHHHHHEHHRRR